MDALLTHVFNLGTREEQTLKRFLVTLNKDKVLPPDSIQLKFPEVLKVQISKIEILIISTLKLSDRVQMSNKSSL